MLKVNEIIDNTYVIEEKIGPGAGEVIYKAYHLRLKKAVVIKKIRQELRGKINERSEVDILKNLKHSYIPQVYDFIEHDGELYTVMEYISGSSLADELKKRKRFPQKRVIKWAIQLCEALSYLHSRNIPIIHSDIKPDNIMLNSEDNLCLIDFNVSMLFSDDISMIGFTKGYSPPEQISVFNIISRMNICKKSNSTVSIQLIENIKTTEAVKTGFTELNSGRIDNKLINNNNSNKIKHRIDEKSDIYSLGASLYHLIFGEKPDSTNIDMTKLNKHNIKIDKSLNHIIIKAINKDPENRYKNIDEMLKDLKNIKNSKKFCIFNLQK